MNTKVEKKKMEEKPHCHFFVQKKKRYCRMTIKEGEKFCGEHIDNQFNNKITTKCDTTSDEHRLRVPCPYDSKHTCFKHQLKKHMARCNAKPGDLPSYIIPGFNFGTCEVEPAKVSLSELSDEYLMSIIKKVHQIHEEFVVIKEAVGRHNILDEELQRPDLGAPARKHLVQNSSLLALMQDKNLLSPNTCYLEMGAGKGKLTFWLAKAVKDLQNCSFALVDRASYRHKNENKLKTPDLEPIRIRADIADLNLRAVTPLNCSKQVVATSKHLCGAATDLALTCVANSLQQDSDSQWQMRGLVMAVCCHHRCVWRDFVGKKFFEEVGLSGKDFTAMCVLASWATCGSGRSRDPQSQEHKPAEEDIDHKHKDRYVRLNLPQEIREIVGRKCKHIIDFARSKYLESIGFYTDIVFYVQPSTTLENVSLVATNHS